MNDVQGDEPPAEDQLPQGGAPAVIWVSALVVLTILILALLLRTSQFA